MADIVLGVGTSHSPQLGVPGEHWDLMRAKDEHDRRLNYAELLKRARPGLEQELTLERFRERDEACQRAIGALGEVIRRVAPDVMVVLGDDQHEQFQEDKMPMLCIYHGEGIPVRSRVDREPTGSEFGPGGTDWMRMQGSRDMVREDTDYPGAPDLAVHLISFLSDEGFDMTRANALREEIGIGHAFGFVNRRLYAEKDLPMVPFMVNTYYPPNTPTPRRCYLLGQALRKAIEAWDADKRVAVLASGGLSHVIIDEELDRVTLDGLMERDAEQLCSLPVEKLVNGTSEIRNWIIAGGALEALRMTLVDYVPTYRSPAGTGCGMAFAYWE